MTRKGKKCRANTKAVEKHQRRCEKVVIILVIGIHCAMSEVFRKRLKYIRNEIHIVEKCNPIFCMNCEEVS